MGFSRVEQYGLVASRNLRVWDKAIKFVLESIMSKVIERCSKLQSKKSPAKRTAVILLILGFQLSY